MATAVIGRFRNISGHGGMLIAMSNSYNLSGLGPAAFEHLVNALAIKILGSGATGFGPGPDGGRDGWFEGEAPYPSTVQRWKGVWYIQSKFHAPHLSKDPQKWLIEQIRAEIATFTNPAAERKWPDNWIIATNVDPSGAAGNGSFDQARRLVKSARPTLASRFHIWGGQKLCAWLDEFPHIARRYGHFMTPGHVIDQLLTRLEDERASVEDIVRYTVNRGIEEQRQTRLEQAGSAEDRRPGIDELFVDLPYVDGRCNTRGMSIASLAYASAGSHLSENDESASESNWQAWRTNPKRSGIWFIRAGPGRGKSSIGQFFCQVQRAALILQSGGVRAHRDIRSLAERIRTRAQELGCWPSVPRIPIWVELKSYAAWFAEQRATAPQGVVSFLCSLIHRDTEAVVTAKTLRRALAERTWVIIFDGLDEVPSDVKDAIASEIVTFARDASVLGDILFVCTSRPQGYAGQFDALGGAIVDLIDLPPQLALQCASKVAAADRSVTEAARAHGLLERALHSPAVRELLTTPLQAHIMAVLVRNGQRPPERKWDLYHKFYEVIREREANRELPDPVLRTLFQRDPSLIDAVHQKLGFALHKKAETATGADASLSKSEFRALVETVVREVRGAEEAPAIVGALVRATTERPVLINTPDQGDRVRFDIRAIQEFFAAEYLYVDTPADVLAKRLELIAGDAHWREVVQFVLGALTALKRATEWTVSLDALRALNSGDLGESALARRLARGALHAALFFDNGAAEHSRKVRDQLRPVIDPLSGSVDDALLQFMGRVSSPESRAWLMAWAKEEIRRLQPADSAGALRIIADLSGVGGTDGREVVDLLETLDTRQVSELLVGRLSREIPDPAQDGLKWELEAETRLLRRKDCVANAARLIGQLIWRAGWRTARGAAARRQRSRHASPSTGGATYIRDVLSRLFDVGQERPVADFSGVVLRRHRLGGNFKPIVSHAESGFLRWLDIVHEAATRRSVARTIEALSWLGSDWTAAECLPSELSEGLPIPLDPRIAPSDVCALLRDITDDQYNQMRKSGEMRGIRLRPFEPFLLAYADGTLDNSFVALADRHPRVAWKAWCFNWGRDRLRQQATPAIELVKPPEGLKAIRRRLARSLEDDPFMALDTYPPFLLLGLAALGDEQERIFARFKAVDLHWSLRFRSHFSDVASIPAVLALTDARLLPVIAAREVAAAWATTRPGESKGPGNMQPLAWTLPLDLFDVVGSSDTTIDERAAALFLLALRQEKGWSLLMSSRRQLLAFAAGGVDVAGGVAVAAEVTGRSSDTEARRLISELIAAAQSNRTPDLFGERQNILNAVIHTWRERSTAPLTKAAASVDWLG